MSMDVFVAIKGNNVFENIVKPVYNGHPWDLKNVAVKQRVL